MNVHKGWDFPRGIYSEVHSPITTPEIICVMALTLQPIRGCPQHSGETGTRLSSAIHRRPLSRFFLREGDVCTQANPVSCSINRFVISYLIWKRSCFKFQSMSICWHPWQQKKKQFYMPKYSLKSIGPLFLEFNWCEDTFYVFKIKT